MNIPEYEKTVAAADPRKFIIIKGAKVHNLQNLTVAIPRNQLTVITGLSGSGKSSLAFHTLFAEGQRRYVESLSAYARQFLGRMQKPDVDFIHGISPAIAIEQKVNTHNPRSTVGTSSEIYDYLKLLFARIGKTYSPISGNLVKRHSVTDVVNFVQQLPEKTTVTFLCPLMPTAGRSLKDELNVLALKGFSRVKIDGEICRIDEQMTRLREQVHFGGRRKNNSNIYIVVDRIVTETASEDQAARTGDSVQTCFNEGNGDCVVSVIKVNREQRTKNKEDLPAEALAKEETLHTFSNRFELDGMTFEEPSEHLFSFNNPYGACKTCEGFGSIIGIDPDLVIPDKNLSVYDGAIVCWKGEKMSEWNKELVMNAYKFDFPIHKPYIQLTKAQQELLWKGNSHFGGIDSFFKYVEEQSFKIQYRVMQARYRGKTFCPDCNGTRLRADANYVKIRDKSITDFLLMPVADVEEFFRNFIPVENEKSISKRLLVEIRSRLAYLIDVGLGYLTMNRLSSSLSGGESQRINLATVLGSSLVGSMYILDEPSIGLHPRDTDRLIGVLKSIRNQGISVIVVEHDEDIMKASDQIMDIGPMAGRNGGNLVFMGKYNDICKDKKSITGNYLSGREGIPVPSTRRKWKSSILIKGARENNLKGIDVKIPLQVMTAVTGVSGSGKTTLIKTILFNSLRKKFGGFGTATGKYESIGGDVNEITGIEMVDQNPIGKSSRSNPITYIKGFDDIRELFASLPTSQARGYRPAHYSFNVDGGRCEMCSGEGEVTIEMQFMPDIHLPCDACGGKRYKQDVLEVTFKDKNISDILNLTVDEALHFFTENNDKKGYCKSIATRMKTLADVGLGYVQLGQSSSTLSGGEAQRIKLASFLTRGNLCTKTLFIFDEPTTGLHVHDIKKLLSAFDALLKQSNTVLIIEHHPEIIKCADWVIDLGPEGGEAGGNLVFEGTPENLVKCKGSYTGKYLLEKMK